MKLMTRRFGEIEMSSEQVFHFGHGIPGFDEYRQYVVLQQDQETPFAYLQCVEDGDVSFILTDPFVFYPNYEFIVTNEIREELQLQGESDCAIYSIVSIKSSLQDATVNLLAPIILNVRAKLGKQVVLTGTPYRTKHMLVPPTMGEKGENTDAGIVAQEG